MIKQRVDGIAVCPVDGEALAPVIDRAIDAGIPVICLRPSWVQNIGYFGAYQSGTFFTATDFVGRLGPYLTTVREFHTRKAALREFASVIKQRLKRAFGW